MLKEEYANENQFKRAYIKEMKALFPNLEFFCIESEETVKGFPDVLVIDSTTHKASLWEFKLARKGFIKFEASQPAFYRKYHKLPIKIVAFNDLTGTAISFNASFLSTNKGSPYWLDGLNRVFLGN